MTKILFSKQHKALLETVQRLGDWMVSLDELTDSEKKLIRQVQACFNKLPKINDGTLAMYGFSLERGSEQSGLVQGWDVSLEYFADDPEQQGGLEIFSSYIPIPETTDKNVLAAKQAREVYFHWSIGNVCNLIQPKQAEAWQQQVNNPLALSLPGDRLRIEVVYGEQYLEKVIVC